MRAYCTTCWAEVSADERRCPECGAAQMDDPRTFDQKLVAALNHPLPETRGRICRLIGQRGMRDAFSDLVHRLDDADLHVRMAAVLALGDLGDERALPLLERASVDRSFLIRRAAQQALRRLGSGAPATAVR